MKPKKTKITDSKYYPGRFDVGDKIRVIKDDHHSLKLGDIHTVKISPLATEENHEWMITDKINKLINHQLWWNQFELVVEEPKKNVIIKKDTGWGFD